MGTVRGLCGDCAGTVRGLCGDCAASLRGPSVRAQHSIPSDLLTRCLHNSLRTQGLREKNAEAMPRHLHIWGDMPDHIEQHIEGEARPLRCFTVRMKRILLISHSLKDPRSVNLQAQAHSGASEKNSHEDKATLCMRTPLHPPTSMLAVRSLVQGVAKKRNIMLSFALLV